MLCSVEQRIDALEMLRKNTFPIGAMFNPNFKEFVRLFDLNNSESMAIVTREPLIKSRRVNKRSASTRIIGGCVALIHPTFIFF